MMKGVSDMAPVAHRQRVRDAGAGQLLEGGEIGGEDLVLGVLPRHESTASRARRRQRARVAEQPQDRKSTRLNSSHSQISYAVFCLKKKTLQTSITPPSLLLPRQTAITPEARSASVATRTPYYPVTTTG